MLYYTYHMHLDFSKLTDVYEEHFFRCTAFTFSSQSMMGYLGKEEEDPSSHWMKWMIMQCLYQTMNINALVLDLGERLSIKMTSELWHSKSGI